ncbi:MAG: bifunctional diguanylate cyclase/phosphodiesterase [Kosmotogaceae bacterium]
MNDEKNKKAENTEDLSVRGKRKEFTLAKDFRVVRNIEQKIAPVNDEKDVLRLLCDSLYDTGKYQGVFCFMINKDKKIIDEYSRGINNISLEDLNDMILKEKSKCFIYPVEKRDIFVGIEQCEDCEILKKSNSEAIISVPLEYQGVVKGLFSVLLEKDKAYDSHEQNQLVALADLVSFKLNKINVGRTLGLVRKELGNEEELFSLFVDHIPAAVFIKDHNSRYIFMNQFFRKIIGHDESHLGKKPHELYSKGIADVLLENDRKALKEGLIECEEKVPDKNGTLRLYSSQKFVINRHKKEPLIGGIAIDITDKRDYQSRLEYFVRLHQILRETTNELLRTELSEETYKELLKRAVEIVPEAESGSLLLKKKDGKYHFVDAINYDKEILKEITFKPDEIMHGNSHKPRIVNPNKVDDRLSKEVKQKLIKARKGKEIKSTLSVPSIVDNDIVAVFSLDNHDKRNAFDDLSVEAAEILGQQMAVLLKRISLEEEIKKERTKLKYLATHDPVTNLPNRRFLEEKFNEYLTWAKKKGRKFSLMQLDINRFRHINEVFGHFVGDTLIKDFGNRLIDFLRENDILVRLEADEFVLLFSDAGYNVSKRIARNISRVMSNPFRINGQPVSVSISIGIAVFPENGQDFPTLLRNAAVAMYHAKITGKVYNFYKHEQSLDVTERLSLEQDLLKAFEDEDKDQLDVFYQPIIEMNSGKIFRLEALCRWKHPKRGYISPEIFIPIAELTGSIDRIGKYVQNRVCEDISALEKSKIHIPITINLSAKELQRDNIVEDIIEILMIHGIEGKKFSLEITETDLLKNLEGNLSKLNRLKKHGVEIYIDDFGTGYSSLSYLQQLPVDYLKIDKSFVKNIEKENADITIIRMIVGLAKNLGLKTVAEGVETIKQKETLIELGCDYAQGFLFCKPFPLNKLSFLKNGYIT